MTAVSFDEGIGVDRGTIGLFDVDIGYVSGSLSCSEGDQRYDKQLLCHRQTDYQTRFGVPPKDIPGFRSKP